MCGIAGQIKFKGNIQQVNITAMCEAQKHRGPDGDGVYVSPTGVAGLGHRRLSFLDLSEAGKQPMTNSRGNLWITYNGEVYNYVELRAELEKAGFTFHSHTDTEVILLGYEAWGADVVKKLKGMFAFGIWNEDTRELFLARDRFGIKPLYYYTDAHSFAFASEIKGLKANPEINTTLDYTSFADFFVYRYVPTPKSIWQEVKKLPAAHYLLLKEGQAPHIQCYWQIPFKENVIADKEAVERFDELLLNSVKTHIRSDVPIGAFLSGGYDSSALVYYMNRIGYSPSTYAIGFEGWDVSEHLFADMVAKQYNTDHHSLILHSQSLDELEHLVWVYDEPNADISIIPTYLICREAVKTSKAVFGGEGSDEILMGYMWQKEYQPARKSMWQQLLPFLGNPTPSHLLNYYANYMSMGRYENNELRKMLTPELHQHIHANADWHYHNLYRPELPDLKAIQYMDIKHFMGELVLAKVDRASMANSLEVRVPFLDHEICEFVMQLQTSVYYKPGTTKQLLYQNIKNHLPQEILARRKQGFVGPDKYYMNIDWYRSRLTNSKLVADGLINESYIQTALNNKDHWRLWKMSVMELWYRRWN